MRLITKRMVIRELVSPGRFTGQKGEAMQALDGETATVADVAAIWGGTAQTDITCYECSADQETAVEVAEEIKYYQNAVVLCESCLLKALALLKGEG